MAERFKTPLLAVLAVLVLNQFLGLSQVLDHGYWNLWYDLRSRPAARDFAVVTLDDGIILHSTSTGRQAELVDALAAAGASKVLIDFPIEAGTDLAGDAALRASLIRAGDRAVLVNRAQIDALKGVGELRKHRFVAPEGTPVAFSNWTVDFAGYFEQTRSTALHGGQRLPAAAMIASGVRLADDTKIVPTFGTDPQSVPSIAVPDALDPKSVSTFQNRVVFVTRTSLEQGRGVGYFGHRRQAQAYADIAAVEGIRAGPAWLLGSLPFLALLALTITLGSQLRRKRSKVALYGSLALVLLVLPYVLMEARIVATPGHALIAGLVYGVVRAWKKWRQHISLTSAASGLPNIEALATRGIPPSFDVVAASISHYEQMLASLPRELHGECARQIARRLSIASGESDVFDSDSGQFVWLTQPYSTDALVAQLEGLKALFAAPLLIDGHVLDTNIHFGLDRNAESTPISRIKSAIVSSTEAQSKGKLYEEFGSKRLAETQWELSLHARIDEALHNGDIWLAYQAQYDFLANEVKSAETLIRWTDPERGPIPPDSFILQAERAGRIDTLTYWVLERAIQDSFILDREVGPFKLSVNLSAWMVDQPGLVQHVSEIVRRHPGLDCSRITFEVTETFSMSNRELAKRNLAGLRAMGFRLSIDDFGTGQSGLAYLAEIPSDELKLDRQFIQAIVKSPRERIIVSNTIKLAHELGQEVVAEGVEDLAIFEALRGLGCDIAQGYFIGRPVAFADFLAELKSQHYRAKELITAC